MITTNLWDSSEVALILIDYQEEMINKIRSKSPSEVDLNIKLLIKAATSLKIPVILSTLGVEMGLNEPTRESIKELLPDVIEIDRTSMNAWKDEEFKTAVEDTGKKNLIFCGIWTEMSLTFAVIDALEEGYFTCIPVDAVGGLSKIAHETAIMRMVHAGTVPNTSLALITEFFRDWKDQRGTLIRPLMEQHLKETKLVPSGDSEETHFYF